MTRAPARFEPGEIVEHPALGTGVVIKATPILDDEHGHVTRLVVFFDRADEQTTHYVTSTTRPSWRHVDDPKVYETDEEAA